LSVNGRREGEGGRKGEGGGGGERRRKERLGAAVVCVIDSSVSKDITRALLAVTSSDSAATPHHAHTILGGSDISKHPATANGLDTHSPCTTSPTTRPAITHSVHTNSPASSISRLYPMHPAPKHPLAHPPCTPSPTSHSTWTHSAPAHSLAGPSAGVSNMGAIYQVNTWRSNSMLRAFDHRDVLR